MMKSISGIKLAVLVVLCLQNSLFTVIRRYSQGVLQENYSKYEVLLFGEGIKIIYSAYIIARDYEPSNKDLKTHYVYLVQSAQKMFMLSLIYGLMNILSYVALRNISAGIFTICAQLKVVTTATFSTIMLKREYSWVKWRALFTLVMGVLLFSEPIWNAPDAQDVSDDMNFILGVMCVLMEVTLSGFASIYFESVIKTDPENLNIWERNFQLALGSFPVYLLFIVFGDGGEEGIFGGWSWITVLLGLLGAAGGLLVALSIKHGDAILKTLATTGAIILASCLDHAFLGGPLTAVMQLAGVVVVVSIFDYSLDPTPTVPQSKKNKVADEDNRDGDVECIEREIVEVENLLTADTSASDEFGRAQKRNASP